MKSIKAKLLMYFGILIVLACLALGVTAYLTSSNALSENAKELISKTAIQASNLVESRITAQYGILETIVQRDEIRDMNIPFENKMDILKNEMQRTGFNNVALGDLNGDAYTLKLIKINLKERPYYQEALKGKNVVTDPLISKEDGSLLINMAVPIKDKAGKVVGVIVAARDATELSNITNGIDIGKTGKAYIINTSGLTIAHYNKDFVTKGFNVIVEAEKDNSLKSLADIQKEMAKGKIGTGEYIYEGDSKYLGYAPIKNTSWILGIAVPKSEILVQLNPLKKYITTTSLAIMLVGFLLVYIVSKLIASNIIVISAHLKNFAGGDFSISVPAKLLKNHSEIGDAVRSMETMQNSIRDAIAGIMENTYTINTRANNLSDISRTMLQTSEEVSTATHETAIGVSNQATSLASITEILAEFGK